MPVKKPKYFEIKASKLQGSGDFNCPKCGTAISPEDRDEKNYRIIGTRTYRDVLAPMTMSVIAEAK
jgi:tRNA(Ile2) C34 agmatinyltransferase TiaS